MTEGVEPGFLPSPETERAVARLERHVEWSQGFWLAYVFTVSPPQAHILQARLERALGARGRELRVLRPASPRALEGILAQILDGGSHGHTCTWVEAVREPGGGGTEPSWSEAWLKLVLRANERRELLRSELRGGLVLVAHPGLKADVRRAGPDLWSVRNFVFELPAGPVSEGHADAPSRVGGPNPLRTPAGDRPSFVDETLLAEELERLPEALAGRAPRDRARIEERLAERLADAGDHAEAARLLHEVVEIHRSLSDEHPHDEELTHELARALRRYGLASSALRRHDEALQATQESVNLYRGLADTQPEVFTPDLAAALNDLGHRQSVLGRHEEALQTLRESVDLWRSLTERWPNVSCFELAGALLDLGDHASALGQHELALQASREAVDDLRVEVKRWPDSFGVFAALLARALRAHGHHLSTLGRWDEALEAAREAVDISRSLQGPPGAFTRALAMSLGALGTIRLSAGMPAQALDAFAEGLRLVLPMAEALPDVELVSGLARDVLRASRAAGQPIPEDLQPAVASHTEPSH